MAKEIKVNDDSVVIEPKGDKQARWDAFLVKYKAKNPVRFARLEANGEFKTIPDLFVG